jgi:hypothetical protein
MIPIPIDLSCTIWLYVPSSKNSEEKNLRSWYFFQGLPICRNFQGANVSIQNCQKKKRENIVKNFNRVLKIEFEEIETHNQILSSL